MVNRPPPTRYPSSVSVRFKVPAPPPSPMVASRKRPQVMLPVVAWVVGAAQRQRALAVRVMFCAVMVFALRETASGARDQQIVGAAVQRASQGMFPATNIMVLADHSRRAGFTAPVPGHVSQS